ncbi:MAG: hypothetical protein J6O99_03530, partial [Methanobrevibacter sp.]|nr:hypothetical protein [Methanobrevibacter sp.]
MRNTIFGGELIRDNGWKLVFTFILFAILAINTVSASNELISSEDLSNDLNNNDINLLANEENYLKNNEIDLQSSEENSLKDENDDFNSIQKLIDNSNDGDSIYLENITYKGNGTPIKVNKNLNIYGYQYQNDVNTVLDADSKSNIFTINPNIQLNLYGLKLINGNSYNGGTITNRGTLNIFN